MKVNNPLLSLLFTLVLLCHILNAGAVFVVRGREEAMACAFGCVVTPLCVSGFTTAPREGEIVVPVVAVLSDAIEIAEDSVH